LEVPHTITEGFFLKGETIRFRKDWILTEEGLNYPKESVGLTKEFFPSPRRPKRVFHHFGALPKFSISRLKLLGGFGQRIFGGPVGKSLRNGVCHQISLQHREGGTTNFCVEGGP